MFKIFCDTRQKQDKDITDYFDSCKNVEWRRQKLYSGDYKLVDSNDVIIDTKANLEEMYMNLCNGNSFKRIEREILNAKWIGCKKFIFLIADENIKDANEISDWEIPLDYHGKPRTRKRQDRAKSRMIELKIKYDAAFIFITKEKMGEKILELLGVLNDK